VLNNGRDILQEDVSWSYFANDSTGIGPEVPFIFDPSLMAALGIGLAGESSRHNIDDAMPRFTVK
jgi:hypothetical protein